MPQLSYIVFLLLPIFAPAQITQRNLLEKNCPLAKLQQVLLSQSAFHPFPQTPADWKKQVDDSILQQLIHTGEESLNGGFPNVPASVTLDFVRNGNRTRYENITFGKRDRLWNLILAESIERKKRFTDAILDGIWSVSEESFWGASAHLFIQKAGKGLPDVEDPVVDLFAAETAANLALADYFIGPELDSISPLIRRRIYYEVNRRIFLPMQSANYEWMGRGDSNAKLNNWTPWIISNYLTAVLLLEKDSSKRIQYVSKAIRLTDQYINGIGEDGGCEEGPSYWAFGAGSALDVLDLLNRASNDRINIYHENIIRNMGAYIYRTHINGNYFVNVADAHPEVNPEAVMIWRFGQAVGDTDLGSFGAWLFRRGRYSNTINHTFHRTRALFDLCSLRSIAADREVFHENPGAWLPAVQLMTERLSNGLFVAAHGGNNGESHNHNDVGDCIVYANGDPVIIDVGSGTYTAKTFSKDRYNIWFNTSAYHNLPTINGQQQAEGTAYAASHVSYGKDRGRTTFIMNIEKAYPAATGLTSWKRMISAGPEDVVIADNFESAKPFASLTQSFMTICDVDIRRPGIIIFSTAHGNKVSLRYGNNWQVTKETLPLITEEEQGLKVTWHNQPITRILLTLRSPVARGRFEYVISTGVKTGQ
ncbi:MAG: heparinase II/III family protein [Bacteroidota bacterium]|nr:heparinase II/III family protein [Bacteroidota bacterium]